MASRVTQFRPVAPAKVENRQSERHAVKVSRATIRRHGGQPRDATVHDLSIYGCRIHAPQSHQAGDRIWLRFHGSVPIAATVVWNESGLAGCRFDEPIERKLLRDLTLALLNGGTAI